MTTSSDGILTKDAGSHLRQKTTRHIVTERLGPTRFGNQKISTHSSVTSRNLSKSEFATLKAEGKAGTVALNFQNGVCKDFIHSVGWALGKPWDLVKSLLEHDGYRIVMTAGIN